MPGDEVSEDGLEFVAHKLRTADIHEECASGLEKQQSGIDHLVFRCVARIRETLRQHSLIYVIGESAQNAKRDAMLASREGFANPAT